jgi:hypothetical protein
MKVAFRIDDTPAELYRNWFTGRSALTIGQQMIPLDNPWDPTTHFTLRRTKTWQAEALGHQVVIEKIRPLTFAGFLPQTYRVQVDGTLITEQTGY